MTHLTLGLSPQHEAALLRLRQITEEPGSNLDVIRKALAVYALIADRRLLGDRVFFRGEDGTETELLFD